MPGSGGLRESVRLEAEGPGTLVTCSWTDHGYALKEVRGGSWGAAHLVQRLLEGHPVLLQPQD